jgi:DNA-binding MarR family transcriptional regulator
VKEDRAQQVGRLIASECLAVRVRRLERVISRIYDAALAEHGINIAQLNLLAAIAASDRGRPSDLTRLLDVEKSTLSRNLKRMEGLGWVHSDPTLPRRGRALRLTPAGSRMLIKMRTVWEKAQSKAMAELGERSFAQPHKLLSSLTPSRGHSRQSPLASGSRPV